MKYIYIIMLSTVISCDTFKPVKQETLSEYPECVVMLNTAEIYKGSDKDKSGTVSPTNECIKSIKRQRCAMEVFNKQIECGKRKIYVVDWNADKDMMNSFNECLLK